MLLSSPGSVSVYRQAMLGRPDSDEHLPVLGRLKNSPGVCMQAAFEVGMECQRKPESRDNPLVKQLQTALCWWLSEKQEVGHPCHLHSQIAHPFADYCAVMACANRELASALERRLRSVGKNKIRQVRYALPCCHACESNPWLCPAMRTHSTAEFKLRCCNCAGGGGVCEGCQEVARGV